METLKENGKMIMSRNVAGHIAGILKRDGIAYEGQVVISPVNQAKEILLTLK
jgi:hypothetical protein